MSPLARSLLAVAVVTLLFSACVDSQDGIGPRNRCTTVTKGKEQGVQKVLDTYRIPAGERTKTVDLPRLCIDNINLAEIVTACDDVPPRVEVRNWPNDRHWPLNTSVVVTRRGHYQDNVATIDVTLWCPH